MSNRELVLDLVRQLPEDSSMEKIAFVAGVNEAIAEADRGGKFPSAAHRL